MNVGDRVYWSATDEFGMAKEKRDALDRIGAALYLLDVYVWQSPEARADVEARIADYDRIYFKDAK